MNPLKIYDYLITTRGHVLAAVRPLTPEQYCRQFDFGLKSIGATLTHIMISEWYYSERFEGRIVPPYDQWPIQYERPPAFDVIEATWRGQMERIRAVVAAERDWERAITWDSFPDEAGQRFHIGATAGDMFTQLALHEVHHRAQVMVMLRKLRGGASGAALADLDYNALVFERRPIT